MNRKHYWVLAILILIIGVVGVYFTLQPVPEPENRYILPSEADNKELGENHKPITKNELGPAKEGYKWVAHDNHFHEVPIEAPNTWQEETQVGGITPETANATPVSDTSKGTSLYDKVFASDEVPKYAELKQMTTEELGTLARESYAKSKSYEAEVKSLRKKSVDAFGSDEGNDAAIALDAILMEKFVHDATFDKAMTVYDWLAGIESQRTRQFSISWTLPEPFDE